MRQTGTVVLIIGIAGIIFFGIKTLNYTTGPQNMDVKPGPFTTGYVPLIISIVIVVVAVLMFISARRKIRK